MDRQPPLFARPRGFTPRRVVLVSAMAASGFLLSGCEPQRVAKLEERLTQVEAKADSAEKRAKSAEALASQTQPIVQPEPAPPSDLDPMADDAYEPVNENDGPGEPPPMADNGKG